MADNWQSHIPQFFPFVPILVLHYIKTFPDFNRRRRRPRYTRLYNITHSKLPRPAWLLFWLNSCSDFDIRACRHKNCIPTWMFYGTNCVRPPHSRWTNGCSSRLQCVQCLLLPTVVLFMRYVCTYKKEKEDGKPHKTFISALVICYTEEKSTHLFFLLFFL